MSRTWQMDEVIRQLADANLDELIEVLEGVGDGAPEALADWIREGNAPKSLYDAVMRFTRAPNQSFDPVDWEAVVRWIRAESGERMKQEAEFYDPELGVVVHVVEQVDTSAQRWALQTRAYSAEGKNERFISRMSAHVRPTTIAQLRLFSNDLNYGFPDLNGGFCISPKMLHAM